MNKLGSLPVTGSTIFDGKAVYLKDYEERNRLNEAFTRAIGGIKWSWPGSEIRWLTKTQMSIKTAKFSDENLVIIMIWCFYEGKFIVVV